MLLEEDAKTDVNRLSVLNSIREEEYSTAVTGDGSGQSSMESEPLLEVRTCSIRAVRYWTGSGAKLSRFLGGFSSSSLVDWTSISMLCTSSSEESPSSMMVLMAAALLPRMEDEREVAVRSIRTISSDDAVGSLLASDDMVGLLLGQRMEGCVRVGRVDWVDF